jgi:hypothetical protein
MFDEDVVRPYEGLFYEWRANKNNIHQMVGHPDMFSHGPDTPDDPFPEDAAEGQLPLKDYVMRVAKERGLSSLQVYSEIEPFLRNRQIRAARDRRLLLQIQSGIEPLTGMSFGRDVYVFIREQDLRRRDFTKVWWDMS